MFEAVSTLVDEHAELERQLSQPETHADARLAKKLNQRYAELTAIVTTWREWQQTAGDIEAARELGADDPDFAAEAERMVTHREELAERLRRLLVPRDATDDKDAIVEVKSGEGGEESALFAGDLLRMYTRYADRQGWTTEVLDATESDLGGYKSVTVAVKAKGTPEPGHAPYALLKFEGGVHRVQRVPVTESQGRVHTSAAGVLVMPEAPAAPEARASTRPTPQSGSPTSRPESWSAARTRRASCRTASRRCASSAPGCWPRPRRKRTPPPARRAAARSARSTAPSASAPTTTPRTASPTTAPATRPTTSTWCSTVTSSR